MKPPAFAEDSDEDAREFTQLSLLARLGRHPAYRFARALLEPMVLFTLIYLIFRVYRSLVDPSLWYLPLSDLVMQTLMMMAALIILGKLFSGRIRSAWEGRRWLSLFLALCITIIWYDAYGFRSF